MSNDIKTVFVALSGGVDSSVAASRLKNEGYRVLGVFIKTWHPDFIQCNFEAERLDAMRVAAALDIPFLTCDAEDAYKRGVADYMIAEYSAGRTPNPDVMCNQTIKFGAFLDFAREHGADYIATGHYARIQRNAHEYVLMRGVDMDKDQSYFLWSLQQEQLARTIFPIGDSKKNDVRKEAEFAGLTTYKKAGSQGICFLGQIDMKEFLSHYIPTQKGHVINEKAGVIGTHDGAVFYTLGQRHGFEITATEASTKPHYVTSKNIETNTITVSTRKPTIESCYVTLNHLNHIGAAWEGRILQAQFRYRQEPFRVQLQSETENRAVLSIIDKTEVPSAGQSCVLYSDDRCLGGGIIV